MANDGISNHDPDFSAMNEARLGALLQAAVDGIIGIDERGIVRTINPAAERMFGYTTAEVLGQNVKMLMPAPYRQEHDGFIGRYLATGEKRIIGIGREVVGRRKDSTSFPMDLSVAEARVGDERIFVGILRDITERKRADEARAFMAALVESSDDAIVGKSLDGTITSWNAGAEKIFGYLAEEMLGKNVSTIAPPDRVDEIAAILDRIKRGERIVHFETVRVHKDGRHIDVSVTVSPIKDAAGRVLGASAIKRDITEQKRRNEEIRAMTQQLWHAAKLASVGELAASIAHELNNPLATVCLRIESVLGKTAPDDPRRRSLEIVEQEARRMGDLVANLLQFARHGSEQISTIDVRQELTKAVELVQHILRKRRIAVSQEFAPDTPTFHADRQKLRQVFLNLLTNAGDAMQDGGTLTLRTATETLDDGMPGVRIDFLDTGTGIPTENLEKIMEPFFTTKEEGKGTGLGLAICRRIVQEHNGALRIVSDVGKGTLVSVVLPIRNGTNATRLCDPGLATSPEKEPRKGTPHG